MGISADQVQEDDDADSSFGDDSASSTASLTSTILKYRTIRGRRYHSEIGNAQYWYAYLRCLKLVNP